MEKNIIYYRENNANTKRRGMPVKNPNKSYNYADHKHFSFLQEFGGFFLSKHNKTSFTLPFMQ